MPTGTVTFLFTDIEGSTRLWEQHPEAMSVALARHDVLMHQSIAAHNGIIFKTIGDACCAAFHTAPDALAAALASQQSFQHETWPDDLQLRVRMALHTGTADERDGDYFGPPLNRVARLLSAGHGGQTLLSLAAYELTRDALPQDCTLQDLGAHSLRDLARPEQVYQLSHPDLLSEFSPLKSLDYLPNNLPQQVTSFVGRELELGVVKELSAKTKLLTLTGSGGSGKTRLSLQAAADLLDQFPDGVWLVELAPITDPDLVPQTVAGVLGIKEKKGETYSQALTEHLRAKTLLLVLDNCEHVLPACAKLVTDLLRVCPNVKVLASSREGLGIAGETVYRIPSLTLPDPRITQTPESLSQYEAVQLFIERAAAARPGFTVTNQNAPALASVCHRLDGIPLAIELAAARVRSLAVEEINSKLDNQFRLLTGGSRTALPRQQTLRALIDWSYDLLTAQEKSLFIRLSVFAGGWTLSAAESVCTDQTIEEWEVLDLLTSLGDKSLVLAEQSDGHTRYRFLETVRQYARDRMVEGDESEIVRGRHRDYFLQMAEETDPKLSGPEQGQWLSVLETEHDNLRQALTFCLEQTGEDERDAVEKGLRLGAALASFWETRGHLSEGRERLVALLARPQAQDHTRVRAGALHSTGNLAYGQGDYESARSWQQESLAIYQELEDKPGIASCLSSLGNIAWSQSDYPTAWSLHQESLALRREMGNRSGITDCLQDLGNIAGVQGDFAAALSFYEESLTIQRELGNRQGIARVLSNMGNIVYRQGDLTAALSLHEESLTIKRALGDRNGIPYSLYNLGMIASAQGDFPTAQSFLAESQTIFREIGNKNGAAACVDMLGGVAFAEKDYQVAQSQYAQCLVLYREMGNKFGIATALYNLGSVAMKRGDSAQAGSQYTESLILFREIDNRIGIAAALKSFAVLDAAEGSGERVPHLLGAMETLREAMGSPLSPGELEELNQEITSARAALGEEAFASAWAEGRAMTMEQAVEYALAG